MVVPLLMLSMVIGTVGGRANAGAHGVLLTVYVSHRSHPWYCDVWLELRGQKPAKPKGAHYRYQSFWSTDVK